MLPLKKPTFSKELLPLKPQAVNTKTLMVNLRRLVELRVKELHGTKRLSKNKKQKIKEISKLSR